MTIQFQFHTNASENSHFFDQKELYLNKFKEIINNPKFGFFKLTEEKSHLRTNKAVYEKFKNRKHFVQIGIGGSALGPQMLIDALGSSDVQFHFMDNTDSDYINRILQKITPKETLFYVVSKSGGTAETVANFSVARNFLKDNGITDFENYFVFCTDPENGHLRKLANEENYTSLDVPSSIGGRFSVLSSVGLLPALFAGIDIDKLFSGAENYKSSMLNTESDLISAATHLAILFEEHNPSVNQTILMPYSSLLKSFSHWFVQLWGESLGKFSESLNKHTGLTPIPAYGATDQHSQMQLFMEGTNDKALFLLEVKNKSTDYKLDSSLNMESARKLNPYTMNQLIEAQFNGTIQALRERKRNVIHMSIDKVNEESLGALIVYFESLTALMGEYLKVDPFNQPGVELGKKYAFEYLNNKQ